MRSTVHNSARMMAIVCSAIPRCIARARARGHGEEAQGEVITQQRDRRREAGKEGKIAWVMALRSPEC